MRLWIAAAVAIAATGLMAGFAITAMAGVNASHTHMPAADGSPCTLHSSCIQVRQTWPWLGWSRGFSEPIRAFGVSGPDSARVTS